MVAAIAVPLALWLWIATDARTRALSTAEADNRRLAAAMAVETLKLLEEQALVLDLVGREAGDRDCPSLRADAGLQRFMSHIADRSPQITVIWVLDANGFICISSDPTVFDERSRTFRDYFSGARDLPPDRYYVDRAVQAVHERTPIFSVAAPRRKDGAFNGVVVASVKLTQLVGDWREIMNPAPTQRIAIFRNDGATVARSWDPILPAPDPQAERRLAAVWHDKPEGVATGPSAIDGARRIGAWLALRA